MADKNKTPKKDGEVADEKKPVDDPAAKPDEKTDTPKTYTEAEYQAALDKAKKDAEKAAEKKVKDAEERAKLSEDEKVKAERDDALKQLRERDSRDAVTAAAEAAGVKNAKLFYNAYKSDLEIDDKGKITNLKDVLESAKTEAPELFTSVAKPEGGADGGDGNSKPNTLTREAIDKMSDSEIAANMEAIDKFLANPTN